ncbi:PREDICTED: zinc finger HIT domain-containing protein 1 [Nicrophorus vespilloides]|uniref:Zinc finger HIT domain-containing protein 1 n=1 Tax=Nicrophorus vespilloides TaxID=110193 RepID=A0ABM1MSJ6_NICVS|nr:PREDICTED: zinc finger HIT domain-containing protein 1 [Nicrophorus vespilloides]
MSKVVSRGSTRLRENERQRIIDDSTRRRRLRKFLENLEADNFHEDPHADLVMSKKVPKFDDNLESRTRSKKRERNSEYYQIKYRKSFQQMIEDDRKEADDNNRMSYMDLSAPQSDFPPYYTCAVCGYHSNYICISCGVRVCQTRCFDTHFETRCLKWTT